jgi:type I restriction enzyme S subunit
MPTVAPAEQVVQIFTKIVRPFLTRAALARNESLTLAAMRDALLPKLISGELRVGEAERVLAASA